eukprot:UN19726
MTKKNEALNRELAVKEDDLLRLQSLRVQLEGELEEKVDATEAAKREITRLRGSQAQTPNWYASSKVEWNWQIWTSWTIKLPQPVQTCSNLFNSSIYSV